MKKIEFKKAITMPEHNFIWLSFGMFITSALIWLTTGQHKINTFDVALVFSYLSNLNRL